MKVLKDFFCSKSKQKYKKGDSYKGSRTKELQAAGVLAKSTTKPTSDKNGAPRNLKKK